MRTRCKGHGGHIIEVEYGDEIAWSLCFQKKPLAARDAVGWQDIRFDKSTVEGTSESGSAQTSGGDNGLWDAKDVLCAVGGLNICFWTLIKRRLRLCG